ncbi:MAG: DUF2155 domain-containing protein [Mariprofundaceae bacterium]
MKRRACLFLALSPLLWGTACDNGQRAQRIEWQIPLESPQDAHGATAALNATLPEWAAAREGEAELVWLHKPTARVFHLRASSGRPLRWKGWEIRLQGLSPSLQVQNGAFIEAENVDNAAAFVELVRDGRTAWRGWLYAGFPELFGLDDPEWKLWLKDIIIRPAAGKAADMRTRSSAG